jgi:hypothetical protein
MGVMTLIIQWVLMLYQIYTVEATSTLLKLLKSTPSLPSKVTQIHMAQGSTPSSMTISWVTSTFTPTEIHYGLNPRELHLTKTGSASQYTFDYKKDNYTSGFIHHTYLYDLLPKTVYYYQCGDFSSVIAQDISGILSFKTLPMVGEDSILTIAIIADLGM